MGFLKKAFKSVEKAVVRPVGGAVESAVNSVGNEVANAGRKVDDIVAQIPGGWATVAALTGGAMLAPGATAGTAGAAAGAGAGADAMTVMTADQLAASFAADMAAAGYPGASLSSLAADAIDMGGGWNPATGFGDAATAAAAAETGMAAASTALPKAASNSITSALNGLRAVNSIGSLLGMNSPAAPAMQPGASRRSATGVDYSQILGLLSNKPIQRNLGSLLE